MSIWPRRSWRSLPSGLATYSTGSLPERNSTPWWLDGRKPADQVAWVAPTPADWNWLFMTMKAGRLELSVPIAWVTQAPPEGRPASWKPVCSRMSAGSWLTWGVQIEWMKNRSSAMAPVWGIRSDTQRPLCPYCLNGAIGPITGNDDWALDMADTLAVPFTEGGISVPCRRITSGL